MHSNRSTKFVKILTFFREINPLYGRGLQLLI